MNLSPETWQSLSSLLDQAMDLAPDGRAAWLEEVARTQPTLVPTLARLLEAHASGERTDVLGKSPAAPFAEGMPGEENGLEAGDRVGPYRLLRPIGSGGMADVWLAERDDGAFAREVALKLPLVSRLRRDLAVRFARERDILARLEHPHIARLYDAGVSADGLPFLAMEYVDGRPITIWCDEHRVDVAGRIRLFAQVLSAVQFAHANLVIHRDLKPSNILVTDDGQVRLLDFGIAKLLAPDEERAPETLLTRSSGRALTPEYASPEQMRGEALTIASDVYSLGVVLFEVLAGTRPYRLKIESAAHLEEAILDAEPLRPSADLTDAVAASRGVSPGRLAKQLAGDLDTVVLKALAKSPGSRYATALALAEDLQRHLDGLPVLARRPSAWYRLRKFVGRNRWPVLVGAGAASALIAATAIALTQAHRATEQQRVAQTEARKATAVKDFLVDLLGVADPAGASGKRPGQITLQEAIDGATGRIGSALADQPEAKMAVLDALSSVYESLDQNERSMALLRDALALSERHDGVPHPNQALFLTELANIEMFAGRSEDARRWLDRAEAVFRALGDTTSLAFAHALKIHGNLVRRGAAPDFQTATVLLEQSVALFRARYPHDQGRSGALFYLAQTLRSVDAADRAEAIADEAVALAGESKMPGFDIPNAYSLRAAIRESNGDLRGADSDYAAATAAYEKTAGEAHFLTLQNVGLHGMTLVELGQRDRGLQMIETSTALLAKTRAGSNTHAAAVERLGIAYVLVGSFERAAPLLEEARSLLGTRHDDLVRTGPTVSLAVARAEGGRYQEARALLDEALAVRRDRAHVSQLPVAEVHLTRGLIALDETDATMARTELEQAITLSSTRTRGDLSRRALAYAGLATAAQLVGDGDAARAAADRAGTFAAEPSLTQIPLLQATVLEAKGTSLCRSGRADEGEPLLASVAASEAELFSPGSPLLARAWLLHAECLVALGRIGEARARVEAAGHLLGPEGTAPHLRSLLVNVRARLGTTGAGK